MPIFVDPLTAATEWTPLSCSSSPTASGTSTASAKRQNSFSFQSLLQLSPTPPIPPAEILFSHPALRKRTEETFYAIPPINVLPQDAVYVMQQECAILPSSSSRRYIGSSDATTCVIATISGKSTTASSTSSSSTSPMMSSSGGLLTSSSSSKRKERTDEADLNKLGIPGNRSRSSSSSSSGVASSSSSSSSSSSTATTTPTTQHTTTSTTCTTSTTTIASDTNMEQQQAHDELSSPVNSSGTSSTPSFSSSQQQQPFEGFAALVGHLDSVRCVSVFLERLTHFLKLVPGCGGSMNTPLELSLVGAFDRISFPGISDEIVTTLLKSLHALRLYTKLTIAAVWDVNTIRENQIVADMITTTTTPKSSISYPRALACAIDVRTGRLYPANFASAGAFSLARSARSMTESTPLPFCFDATTNQYLRPKLGQYSIDAFFILHYLSLKDQELLDSLSTSPRAEPPKFVSNMRASLRWMLDLMNGHTTWDETAISTDAEKNEEGGEEEEEEEEDSGGSSNGGKGSSSIEMEDLSVSSSGTTMQTTTTTTAAAVVVSSLTHASEEKKSSSNDTSRRKAKWVPCQAAVFFDSVSAAAARNRSVSIGAGNNSNNNSSSSSSTMDMVVSPSRSLAAVGLSPIRVLSTTSTTSITQGSNSGESIGGGATTPSLTRAQRAELVGAGGGIGGARI